DPRAPVPAEALARLDALLARRAGGTPMAHLLGRREFWSLDIAVGPEVLIPRPDSESLIEAAADVLGGRAEDPLRLLDLGTGSGSLLLALLTLCPKAFGVGVDLSPAAAARARANARALGLGGRAAFLAGDWGSALAGPFDLVLSNPPYIETAALTGLQVEVRDHEPRLALDGGADGLAAYRALLPAGRDLLGPRGVMIVEIGRGQAEAVTAIGRGAGLDLIGIREDLGGRSRGLVFAPRPALAPAPAAASGGGAGREKTASKSRREGWSGTATIEGRKKGVGKPELSG
ncbi:MAG: peptide chain release factor N(5)-glutamine methyltransferase, partial [Alphaproteobacteria bacterium]|nr:peptide chain release factor N(5)-glutamine methyltransferase [Alphaproteobacteria bacterium]